MMRPVKTFCVMARLPDGTVREVDVVASCFESAIAQALSQLPPGSAPVFASTEL